MIFVVKVSRWFRFKLWFAFQLVRFANFVIESNPALAKTTSIVSLTEAQLAQLQAETRSHTLQ